MGALETPKGERLELSADHLVGRVPEAALVLTDESASRRHATIRWTGRHWELLDLGSLNGSFVDDVRVPAGGRVHLVIGARLRFGESSAQWQVIDAAPPGASVVALDTGQRFLPSAGIIAVPDAGEPLLAIYQTADGAWLAENSERAWNIVTDEVVVLGGARYRFEAGHPVATTLVAGRGTAPTPERIALDLTVSRNEEQVDITMVYRGQRIQLRPRAHSYVLLTLARLRLADQQNNELPETSHGWVDQDQLVKQLATTRARLALDVYRARMQFAEAGLQDAAMLVERRITSRELRIGIGTLSVQQV